MLLYVGRRCELDEMLNNPGCVRCTVQILWSCCLCAVNQVYPECINRCAFVTVKLPNMHPVGVARTPEMSQILKVLLRGSFRVAW